jgi:hypothetical protein
MRTIFARSGAANNGVVNEDDTLAVEQIADRVELEADAEVADALLGLNKGAADVVIADEAETERQGGLFGVAQSSGHAGIGHGYDDIGGQSRRAQRCSSTAARRLHIGGWSCRLQSPFQARREERRG